MRCRPAGTAAGAAGAAPPQSVDRIPATDERPGGAAPPAAAQHAQHAAEGPQRTPRKQLFLSLPSADDDLHPQPLPGRAGLHSGLTQQQRRGPTGAGAAARPLAQSLARSRKVVAARQPSSPPPSSAPPSTAAPPATGATVRAAPAEPPQPRRCTPPPPDATQRRGAGGLPTQPLPQAPAAATAAIVQPHHHEASGGKRHPLEPQDADDGASPASPPPPPQQQQQQQRRQPAGQYNVPGLTADASPRGGAATAGAGAGAAWQGGGLLAQLGGVLALPDNTPMRALRAGRRACAGTPGRSPSAAAAAARAGHARGAASPGAARAAKGSAVLGPSPSQFKRRGAGASSSLASRAVSGRTLTHLLVVTYSPSQACGAVGVLLTLALVPAFPLCRRRWPLAS